jgi:hypothetical protein
MKLLASVVFLVVLSAAAVAQTVTGSTAITTSAPFLTITPDSRHAGLGEAGVASSPDANGSYWNPGKMVFIDKSYGGSLSYTPWLGKIVNDMDIAYLSGFYKITREQVVSASLKYFNMGEIFFRTADNVPDGDYHPRDWAVDLSYSRLLTENFSVGLTGRFIRSNLTGFYQQGTIDAKPGQSAAADVGVFYKKPMLSTRITNVSFGAVISNIGSKITYSDDNNRSFIPINLRLGSAVDMALDPFNTFTFLLDFNKLMVPSPNTGGEDKSLLSGMFGSFSDAPGGFSEEIDEFTTSVGVEYWYNAVFAARLGYFNEAQTKGNRKYLTLGVGFRKNDIGIDVAYLAPTNGRENALAETIRFTLLYQIPEIASDPQESVTDQ